jgi:3,4-dihydroxy 2-butanone 4-phosphate synthase/GTP cyclohydrolase II
VADGHVVGEASIQPVVEALSSGKLVLLAEDGDEGAPVSLIASAQHVTAEQMEVIMQHARLPRLAMDPDHYSALYESLHQTVLDDQSQAPPAMSVSVQHGESSPTNSTHVAETLRALAGGALDMQSSLRCPGVVSLACATRGGLLKRAGATEAALELAKLAGLDPAMALQAELRQTGWDKLRNLSDRLGAPFTTTADLVAHLRRTEVLVERCGPPARMPTSHGLFTAHCFRSLVDGIEHIALVKAPEGVPDLTPFSLSSRPALVRVHSECCTGDIFGSLRCDCGPQLNSALEAIERDGYGVLLYLRGQEGRGIGLGAKMHAYSLQERGVDTLDANTQLGLPVDSREYGTGAQMLVALGISDMRLISNNPKKFSGLAGYGLRLLERVPSKTEPNPNNIEYLRTKARRMGHMLDLDLDDEAESRPADTVASDFDQ